MNKEVYFNEYCRHCAYLNTDEDKHPCNECLTCPVNEDSHKPTKFEGDFIFEPNPYHYTILTKHAPYLYSVSFDEINTNYAKAYFRKQDNHNLFGRPGSCSSVRNGNFYGRNFDWTYNDLAEFVVKVNGTKIKYMGVAGNLSKLTESFVSSGKYAKEYELLPFRLLDGINEYGVVASMNVVPADYGDNSSVPVYDKRDSIDCTEVVSYILRGFTTAWDAVKYIRDHVEVIFSDTIHKYGYEIHYMVADEKDTFVLEFIGHRLKICDIPAMPYITNFYIYPTRFNSDGTVYTPETQDETHNAMRTNNITENGSGLERYNLIVNNYDISGTKAGMRELMDMLRYTRAYLSSIDRSDPYWYTEFVGERGLTVASTPEQYAEVVQIADGYYKNRNRGTDNTWQTVHSSVYDIENRCLYLKVQEEPEEYAFIF